MRALGPAVALATVLVLTSCTQEPRVGQSTESFDWRTDWGVAEGFTLAKDTESYQLPSALAFVPEPGARPGDPLYFVTELRGTVKVVSTDRTVNEFAQIGDLVAHRELPEGEGQTGLAGICLDPENGYVFVTYAYRDGDGILRNNVARLQVEPGTFRGAPQARVDFTDVFAPYEAALSHQIGGCQVQNGALFIGVGDGGKPNASQELDQLLGKVVRMDLDGQPPPDNPFYETPELEESARYVFAYGLRNPFGIQIVDGEVFVADNGPAVDRFVRVDPGQNYQWDGSDWSMGSLADAVFSPNVAPVQLEYLSGGSSVLPEQYGGAFFFAAAGSPGRDTRPGVMRLPYDLSRQRTTGTVSYLVEYRGQGEEQMVAALGLGPDAFYFAPILPNQGGESPIYRLSHDPAAGYPLQIGGDEPAYRLMVRYGCFACHSLDGRGGTVGPTLDRIGMGVRLRDRLQSDAYVQQLGEIDRLDQEPWRAWRQARQEVLEAQGGARIRAWVKYRIIEPRFDNTTAQMPNLGVTEEEASRMASFLIGETVAGEPVQLSPRSSLRFIFRSRAGAIGFGAGFLSALLVVVLWRLALLPLWHRRRQGAQDN